MGTTTTDGLLLVDKPAGLTSHDVVAVVRRALGERRIGHAGTLDPFATGLLGLPAGGGAEQRVSSRLPPPTQRSTPPRPAWVRNPTATIGGAQSCAKPRQQHQQP